MRIIGCDYHPGSNKLRLWIPTQGNCKSDDDFSTAKNCAAVGLLDRSP
jgi:hypothetical protein